jgi:hypothetical protein
LKILIAAAVVGILVLSWGYWYSLHHADLNLRVKDYALSSPNQLYVEAHNVSIVFRDTSGRQLATARSVEPLGYILAVNSDAAIGNCQHLNQQREFAACYGRYSKWSATWAPLVRTADVAVASCSLHAVPVTVEQSNNDWPLWWVPLRHIGGLPREYFSFTMAIDSRACVPHDS